MATQANEFGAHLLRGFNTRNDPVERITNELFVSAVFNLSNYALGFGLKKELAPLFQPIRSKTKTKRDSLARVFPRLTLVACIALYSDPFIALFAWSRTLVWRNIFV